MGTAKYRPTNLWSTSRSNGLKMSTTTKHHHQILCNHASSTKQPHPPSPISGDSNPRFDHPCCHGRGMDATGSSTVTDSSISSSSAFQLIEISLISAQDLSPVCKSLHTYAVAWVHPNRKFTTKTDQQGNKNPTWNEKFVFRVENESLLSEDSTVSVEIYTTSWFKDVLVGSVRVLISDLLVPLTRSPQNSAKNTRFIALQVRRPSGAPQGILNMGIALVDTTMRSMPLNNHAAKSNLESTVEKRTIKTDDDDDDQGNHEPKREYNTKVHLWRSLSVGSGSEANNEDSPVKNESLCNGSNANGSELCSDIGPSASVVAAELAKKRQPPPTEAKSAEPTKAYRGDHEAGSSILEDMTIEEAKAKGYRVASRERWRKAEDYCDESDLSNTSGGRHPRRNSDGGLFSCFGNAYGIEVSIVCGAMSKHANSHKRLNGSRRKNTRPSEANSA